MPSFLKIARTKWTFQPPRTLHFGGAYETMVRWTKRALYHALQLENGVSRHPTENLRTLLFEVVGLLNTRPLTYASSDLTDFRLLISNNFLTKFPTAYQPDGSVKVVAPRDHYRNLQRLLNLFWDQGKCVYLQSLAARKTWENKRPNFAVRDVDREINKTQSELLEPRSRHQGFVRAVDVQLRNLPSGYHRIMPAGI